MPRSAALEIIDDVDAAPLEDSMPLVPPDAPPAPVTTFSVAPAGSTATASVTTPAPGPVGPTTASVTTTSVSTAERAPAGSGPAVAGPVAERLKAGRLERGLSVRGLARQVGVSPSLVSQIENGKANPSVGTLYAIVSALDVSLDELFGRTDRGSGSASLEPTPPLDPSTAPTSAVMRSHERPSLTLETGVQWDRLTPDSDGAVDFLQVTYGVGAASCAPDALLRHNGREYGFVLSGRLGATVGFDDYELGPGDSIAVDSATPHRFWAIGNEPARVVWTVVGRGCSAPQRA